MAHRVLIAGFMHETNTFSALPTDSAAYRARSLYQGQEVARALGGTRTEIAAFLDACERNDWHAVHPIFANATPSGKVTRDAFEYVSERIVECVRQDGPFDALLLALHGAMVTEHADDGEGLLLTRLRERIPRQVPIAVTLDLHANVTDTMAELADIIVSYRTYPHVDQYEVASEAAGLLARTLAGEIRPMMSIARGPMLDGADHGRTTAPGPMSEVLTQARALHESPGVLSTSINAGFPWVDIHDTGPTALICHDGPGEQYQAMASALIDSIWSTRHRSTVQTLSSADALARIGPAQAGAPVVLADFADNPGGGGYGDATRLLKAMLEAGLHNAAFATIYDPEVATLSHGAGEGAHVNVSLGGKIDPRYGEPLAVSAEVVRLTDGRFDMEGPMMQGTPIHMGPTAVLRSAGVDVVVTSGRFQALDRGYMRHAGIEPDQRRVVAVKSAHHFRAAFGPIASDIHVVDDGGGLTSRNFRELSYTRVRRPVFPLDLD